MSRIEKDRATKNRKRTSLDVGRVAQIDYCRCSVLKNVRRRLRKPCDSFCGWWYRVERMYGSMLNRLVYSMEFRVEIIFQL